MCFGVLANRESSFAGVYCKVNWGKKKKKTLLVVVSRDESERSYLRCVMTEREGGASTVGPLKHSPQLLLLFSELLCTSDVFSSPYIFNPLWLSLRSFPSVWIFSINMFSQSLSLSSAVSNLL